MSELPPELRRIADGLRAQRDEPDGHLLERVQGRAIGPRGVGAAAPLRRVRLSALAIIVAVFGMNVTGALATALKATGLTTASASGVSTSQVTTAASTVSSSNSSSKDTYVEKPGCGNEQNIGISGNSGAHGGQPPKAEERGDCPHTPGVDGN